MISTRSWWNTQDFEPFLRYIKATAAGDKRNYHSPRFDLKSATPMIVESQALHFLAPCVACGRLIHPFRKRVGGDGVYLAVSCENAPGVGCSKGRAASDAYQRIWQKIKDLEPQTERLL